MSPAEHIPTTSASIINGMSGHEPGNNRTFAQVAELALTQVHHERAQSEKIDVVLTYTA